MWCKASCPAVLSLMGRQHLLVDARLRGRGGSASASNIAQQVSMVHGGSILCLFVAFVGCDSSLFIPA